MATATSKKPNPVNSVVASTPKKVAVRKSPVAAVKKAVVAKSVSVEKTAPKLAPKPAPKAKPAPVTKPAPAPKAVKAAEVKVVVPAAKLIAVPVEKVKKAKLVRDSFTMPESEYAALGAVKKACLKAGVEVKKSQLLRIGVALLSKTDVPALKKLIAGLAPLKAGRPKKEK
ncbi:hypothetical protein H8L32_19590 [Undibacterium sp. CY18W]|uniref:Histone H1-like nucleoprotein HC2 n=1 Tax=Undibacterium hunanense TaxID=2762292 RepID=A0ABR6ZV54_9BURK|nr:hypothetical protein [Undibacterium hunanense]MBC3919689.1 hypothetical protein [Undibacterium hunanense]